MRLNEVTYTDAEPVEGYGPGFFRIGGKVYEGAVLTGPDGSRLWDGYEDTDTLLDWARGVDVMFIGTGAEIAHLAPALRTRFEQEELAFEVMNSPSAARTYNVLLSEGRRVALALIPV